MADAEAAEKVGYVKRSYFGNIIIFLSTVLALDTIFFINNNINDTEYICSDRTIGIIYYTSDIVIGTGIVYCARNRS